MPWIPFLFRQETAAVRTVCRTSKGFKEIFHVLGAVFLCILKIIINGIVHVQSEPGCFLRLGCVAQHQELVGAVLFCMIHTVRRQCILNPQLGSVWMGTAIEDCGSANLKGGSVFRYD